VSVDQRRKGWILFSLFSGMYLIAYFYRVSAAVVSADIAGELALSPAQLGSIAAALFYAFAFAQIPLGPLLDRYGSRRIVGVCGLVAATGGLLFASAQGFSGLFGGRLLLGFGTAAVLMGSLKAYTRWFPGSMFATLTGLQIALGNCGSLLATAPLAWAAHTYGWRYSFALVALVNMVWALLILLLIRDAPSGAEPQKPVPFNFSAWGQLLKNASFRRLSLLAFFWYGSYMAVQGLWGAPYLELALGLDNAAASRLLMLTAIGFIFGCPLLGRLSDRWLASRKHLLLSAQLVQWFILLLFVGPLEHLPPELLPAIFFIFGLGISSGPLLYAQVKELVPGSHAATALTLLNFFIVIGAAVLQQLMGLMSGPQLDASGLQRAFLLPVVGLGLAILLYARKRDSAPA
jgi:predicted MFS family arabinose efflux permease